MDLIYAIILFPLCMTLSICLWSELLLLISTPKYLYWLTSEIRLEPSNHLVLLIPRWPTTTTLDLSWLKLSFYLFENDAAMFSIVCKSLLLSAIRITSSAQNKHPVCTLQIRTPTADSFIILANSFIKIQNRTGERTQPCFTPSSIPKKSVIMFPNLTWPCTLL